MYALRHTKPELDQDTILNAFGCALAEAELYEGSTSPNPAVGCVLLDAQGSILACEAHQVAGQGHAEARAIDNARMRGTLNLIHTAIVTLEPCNHRGRTSPCVEALLSTPVQTVWIACRDPNPDVKGGGAEALAAAGISVFFLNALDGHDAQDIRRRADRLIAPFSKIKRTGLPFVTIKQALDEQNSMIPAPGQKTFTSPSSLTFAHRLRRRADAILTGSGTILSDKPELTVRHVPDFAHKKRFLVILDRRGRVPGSYLSEAAARGFTVLVESDLHSALRKLAGHSVMEILLEAGPTLTAAVLNSNLWDEHVVIRKTSGPDDISVVSNPNPLI
jgi:diaminohydroxyphosphoribosylaminopyrimidine deaminase/5-amino-6-(5-phosphoribosylamino)uracil reductase